MLKTMIVTLLSILNVISAITDAPVTIPSIMKCEYNYDVVLRASLLFYEAQRSGKLPADNRIPWRSDSMLDDRGDNGEDLTGGYFDAGDHVKFGFPMAYTISVTAWGLIDYESAFVKAGELENARKMIKWGTDYFIKAHTEENEFYGQVGKGDEDHAFWGRPEDWPTNQSRPAFKINETHPGSDLAGETAAALAAASVVFRQNDSTYATKLLTHAKQLYKFANEFRDTYSNAYSDAREFYSSREYGDELGWSAAWLYRATNDTAYRTDAEKHFTEFHLDRQPLQMNWGGKSAYFQALMAHLTKEQKYIDSVAKYSHYLREEAPKTPKGLVMYDGKWGSLRHASEAALFCLRAAELGINVTENREFAKRQVGYALGDTGRSFVVGLGVNPPQRPHHRAASCPNPPDICDHSALTNPKPDPHVLTGALVGGPDLNDTYADDREDYVLNEVACDYNAGFQSAVAGLAFLKNAALL